VRFFLARDGTRPQARGAPLFLISVGRECPSAAKPAKKYHVSKATGRRPSAAG
jgi:hypothetical protein